MSGSNTKIEWYLARDGQQHGPLSDPELKKFIELGHLHPTDLVWRAGFPEWRTASEVFPETAPAAPPAPEADPGLDAGFDTGPASGPEPAPDEDLHSQPVATEIEDISPAQETPAPTEPSPVEAEAQRAATEEPAASIEPVNEVTRPDSPTQRNYPASAPEQEQPTPTAAVPEEQQTKPAEDISRPDQQAPMQPNAPMGQAPGQFHPSANPTAQHSQPQFQRTDPRLGGAGQAPQGSEPHAPGQPTGNPQQAGSPQAGTPQGGPTQNPSSDASLPYGVAPGQPRGQQPHPQNAWQAPGGPAGNRHPGAGPQQSAPQQGYGAGNPNMYGHPGAGVYPGGPGGTGAPGGPTPGQPHPGFQQANPQQQRASLDDEDDFYDDDDFDQQPRRRPIVAALVSLVLIAMIGAGGWFAYANQAALMQVYNDLTKEPNGQPSVVSAPASPARVAADNAKQPNKVKTASATPATKAAPAPAAVASYVELPIFKTQFWRSFNALYPAWAKAQESNAGKLQANGKSSDEVLATVVKSLVEWRRSKADNILAASPDHLRTLAKTFVANLQFLVTQDVQACYGYISKGELSPTVLPLFGNPNYVSQLGTQTEAIIAAAQNGTSSKKTYPEPINQDFSDLANLLVKRGWTEKDLKMFSDPTELSTAPASKVCTLVTQWFETQLQMPPGEKQMRLLATSLQPVVRG